MLLLLVFALSIRCDIMMDYGYDLLDILSYFNESLDDIDFKNWSLGVVSGKEMWILILTVVVAVFITFCGVKFEKYSLSIFLGVFIFTLVETFDEVLKEYIPIIIRKLPESIGKHISPDLALNTTLVSAAAIIIGIMIFLALYNLLKLISMVILTYFVFDWFVKTHIPIPETLDWVTRIAVFVGVIVFYIFLRKIYTFIFALVFSAYGSLFILSIIYHAVSKQEGFTEFISLFYRDDFIFSELKQHRETLFWIIQASVGLLFQISI